MKPANSTQAVLSQISQLIDSGELLQAKTLCISSLQQFPDELNLSIKLSSIYESMGEMEIAQQVLENKPELLHHLAFLNHIMRFYLRCKKYFEAQDILNLANQNKSLKVSFQKTIKIMNIVFNSVTKQHELNIKLSKEYISNYPKDAFGYSHYIQSIDYLKFSSPEEIAKIQDLVQRDMDRHNIPIHVTKRLLRIQHKLYSISEINSRQIADPKIDATAKRKLLLERLQLLLSLKQDNQEVELIVDDLFATKLSTSEINILLAESRKYEPLESKLIAYIEQNPRWLEYAAVRKQLQIIQNCRSLKTKPLTNRSDEFPHPVDVVYTWCDMDDPAFVAKFEAQNGFDPTASEDEGTGKCRYLNSQEIKLAIASLFKYFNAVNKIYIVTNEQSFDLDFLTLEQRKKVRFVDHREIMPREYIQGDVFNSNLIETFLWNILNLQEHFLYFCDDMILGNYLKPSHLFDCDNQALALIEPRKHSTNLDLASFIDFHGGNNIPWTISRANAVEQFVSLNKIELPVFNMHQGKFFVRSQCEAAFYKYRQFWQDGFFKEMLRGQKSVYGPLVYLWESIIASKQKLGNYDDYNRSAAIFNAELNEENLRQIRTTKPLFYCVNHVGDLESQSNLHSLVDHVLNISNPDRLYELIDYLAQATEIKNLIYISTNAGKISQRISDRLNVIEIELTAEDANPASLSEKLALDEWIIKKSIIVCDHAIEKQTNPTQLIDTLAQWSQLSKYVLIAAPDRERVTNPQQKAHLLKWNLQEFCSLLSRHHLPIGFRGHTRADRFDDAKTTSLVISGTEAVYRQQPLVPVTAIINCYNEADIIKDVILHLVEQEVRIVVADNWSNDGSYEIVQQLAAQFPEVEVTRFPDAPTPHFDLSKQLANTVAISERLGQGWYLHYDADEIRQSPWRGVNLRTAISLVDALGYNAIDFGILNFRYLKGDLNHTEGSLSQRLRHCDFGEQSADFLQIKGWKYYGQAVDLKTNGGHHAKFAGQKVYPFKFLTKHYPLRSPQQAHQKLFRDRFPRFRAERQQLKRHVHYDHITKQQLEGWDRQDLFAWDENRFETEYLIERISGVGLSSLQSKPDSAVYEQALESEPNNPRLHFMLAKTQIAAGNLKAAIASAQTARDLDPENVDFAEQLSDLLVQVGRKPEAFALVNALCQSQPENPRIYLVLARIQRQQKDFSGEIATYQKLVKLALDRDEHHIYLGNLLIQANRLDEAIAVLQECTQLFPDLPRAYLNLSRAYERQQQMSKAISSGQTAFKLEPHNLTIAEQLSQLFLRTKQTKAALAFGKYLVESQPNNAKALLILANIQNREDDLDATIATYQKLTALIPTRSDLYVHLGNMLLRQNRHSEAAATLEQAVKLHSDHAKLHFALGRAYYKENKIKQAIFCYQRAIDLGIDRPSSVYTYLAIGLESFGHPNQALLAHQTAVALEPDNFNAYLALGNYYRQQQDWDHAIAAYQKTLNINPQNPGVCFTLAQVLRQQQRLDEAILAYQNCLRLQPNNVHAYVGLGNCYTCQQKLDPAIATYHQALDSNPRNPRIRFELGKVLLQKGKKEDAISKFQQAIDGNHPNLFAVYKTMGDTLQEIEQIEQAITAFEQALAIKPDHPVVKNNLRQLTSSE